MHLVSGGLEERDHHRTYVAAVAGDEDLHHVPQLFDGSDAVAGY